MILVIDNYDSFAHNLARYMALAGHDYDIARNDKISLDEIAAKNPQAIILSPGPCTPKEAGICIEAVQRFGATTPIFGVCLGHQAIGEAYGGTTIRHDPVHGKAATIHHDGTGLFAGLPQTMSVGRYHSLITKLSDNSALEVTARACDGTIMAMQHKTHPVYGVQFHPESVLTPHGLHVIKNFTNLALHWHNQKEHAA